MHAAHSDFILKGYLDILALISSWMATLAVLLACEIQMYCSKSQPTSNNSLHSQLESLHFPPSIVLTCREKHFRACGGRRAKVPACDRCWVRRREVEQSCRDTMDSDPIRDKSTRRDRFTLRHKHSVGTDLEAPVVWLLLRGRQENKETGGGDREEHGVRRFLPSWAV